MRKFFEKAKITLGTKLVTRDCKDEPTDPNAPPSSPLQYVHPIPLTDEEVEQLGLDNRPRKTLSLRRLLTRSKGKKPEEEQTKGSSGDVSEGQGKGKERSRK